MRMIVLGAGASFGRTDGLEIKPPLTSQFFSKARELGLFAEEIYERWAESLPDQVGRSLDQLVRAVPALDPGDNAGHLAVLKGFVSQQLGIEPEEYSNTPLDIERLMGLIEGELLGYHGFLRLHGRVPQFPGPSDVLQQQLYLILCGTLIATTAGTCSRHELLAESLEQGDVVVSFNYDLLIDRALRATCEWFPNDGYGLSFHKIGRRSGDEVEWRTPLETQSSNLLLKPHGSLNWLFPADAMQTNVHVDLHDIPRSAPPRLLYCLEDMHTDFLDDHPVYEWWERYEHQDEEHIWDMLSLIVPPAVTKPYRDLEPLIGGVWARTLNLLLSRVEELVFIGYSFRPEDLRSWWMFTKAADEGERLRRVQVVDPSDEVLGRIGKVFRQVEVERPAATLEELLGA